MYYVQPALCSAAHQCRVRTSELLAFIVQGAVREEQPLQVLAFAERFDCLLCLPRLEPREDHLTPHLKNLRLNAGVRVSALLIG